MLTKYAVLLLGLTGAAGAAHANESGSTTMWLERVDIDEIRVELADGACADEDENTSQIALTVRGRAPDGTAAEPGAPLRPFGYKLCGPAELMNQCAQFLTESASWGTFVIEYLDVLPRDGDDLIFVERCGLQTGVG